ncbi:hypothetical protein O6H91_02G125600 [Diphasiastrum complanatum]|uniref:Uncharacterized protein n=1 Tax=Diphasiastrum complanatum TaxID=34168 RepID=A0ACC2EKG8_DIPCM|nr:hypothetical protein O6H91_02G125600 [Diphasiastrum complanatum]
MGDAEVRKLEEVTATSSPVLISKLKPSSNQVAGHQFEGHLGSLVDESGNFFKPLQDGERGEREVIFYEKFWADKNVPTNVKRFFPRFHGTVLIDNPDGAGATKHAILEDLSSGLRQPCIMDIKMGFRTWYPEASEAYKIKCSKKDEETTSASLGFRICGLQVYDAAAGSSWKADRNWCRKLRPSEVPSVLKRFVSTNPYDDEHPNASKAQSVYGGPHGVISKLKELQDWFEVQTTYHFSSSSVLIIYEGDASPCESGQAQDSGLARVKFIDFAHVSYGQVGTDENYLGALKSLMSYISASVGERSAE